MAASTYGKTRSGVARAPCGYDRLFSSMNDLDLLPDSPILAAHSSRSLPPAQLSNRGVPVTPNPTTESGRSFNVRAPCTVWRRRRSPSEQPNAVHFRLRSWMFNSSFMTDPTPPYAPICPSLLPPLSCDACIANTAMRVLLLDVCPVGSSA